MAGHQDLLLTSDQHRRGQNCISGIAALVHTSDVNDAELLMPSRDF